MTKTPFDFLNSITYTKENLMETNDDEKEYNPWMVNKGLSMHVDTVLYANEMNMNYHLPNSAQYAYLINTIRKRKRYGKWPKLEKDPDVEMLSEFYQINSARAKELNLLLSEEDKENIRNRMIKGGKE